MSHPLTFERHETPRLVLRRLRDDDAAVLAAYRSDPDVARYQSWPTPFSEERALELVASVRNRQPGQPGWFQFAIADKTTDTLLGDGGLNVFEARQGEIGYTLAPWAQGRGYATEAVSGLLDLAFGDLDLHRVVARTDPRNARSGALLRRLGFRHEGRFLESYWDGEAWLDDDQFALLAREWRPRRAAAERT